MLSVPARVLPAVELAAIQRMLGTIRLRGLDCLHNAIESLPPAGECISARRIVTYQLIT